ncbi:hypothetical protein [Streptomyces sp. Tue6028]
MRLFGPPASDARDQGTKQPTTEADLIADEQTFPELYFLSAPDLVSV